MHHIREEDDDAIKKDFPDFTSHNGTDGKSRANGNDLLLFFHDALARTKGNKDVKKMQNHHDIHGVTKGKSASSQPDWISGEKQKISVRFKQKRPLNTMSKLRESDKRRLSSSANVDEPITVDVSGTENGFKFDGSPTQHDDFNSAANPYRFPDAASHYHSNHQHQLTPQYRLPNHHQNRFHVNKNGNEAEGKKLNENELAGNAKPASVINDPFSHKTSSIGGVNARINHQKINSLSDNKENSANALSNVDVHGTFDEPRRIVLQREHFDKGEHCVLLSG